VGDRMALVTGATSGIGRATALELARRGLRVIVHGRDESRCRRVADEVAREYGDIVPYLVADFTSLDDVRRLAEDVRALGHLEVLVANAGRYMRYCDVTPDGYETTFQVNHLAHFLLVNELLDTLEASSPARIVVVSSEAHRSGHIDFDTLTCEHRYHGYRAYANSKLANVLFAYGLAERLDPSRVTANALHPGNIATKLLHDIAGVGGDFGRSPEEGAETSVYAATAPELAGVTGEYFVQQRPHRSSEESHDLEIREQLWRVSARLTSAVPAGR